MCITYPVSRALHTDGVEVSLTGRVGAPAAPNGSCLLCKKLLLYRIANNSILFSAVHHAQHTRSSLGSDRQSGRGSLPHLASLPIPSLGAGRTAVLLAPSTTLATTTMRRCGAPACLHHACARWLRAANRRRPPREQWATPQGSARGEVTGRHGKPTSRSHSPHSQKEGSVTGGFTALQS